MKQLFPSSALSFEAPMSAERDFLSSIFSSDQPYPWDSASPDREAYLDRLEAALDDPAVDAAIAAGWDRFSAQMETCWARVNDSTADTLLKTLRAEFQGRMPEDALGSIATAAAQLVQSGRPLAEQLVETVKTLLPSWEPGDLAVLARPLAYSLRDGQDEILDLTLRSVPQADWETLPELEKARLSLAIASVALNIAKQDG
jgi:hypothetical protein